MANPVTFCVAEREFDAMRSLLNDYGAEWDERHSEGEWWGFNVKDVGAELFQKVVHLLSGEDVSDATVEIQHIH